jgi:Glycosyl transferase family 2
MKLLSISIPTYERFAELQRLFNAISEARNNILNFDDLCEVLIFDNASSWSDGHSDESQFNWGFAKFHRHPKNIGADENARVSFIKSTARYVWIFGDDDLPRVGVIAYVLRLLQESQPNLVYLKAQWSPPDLMSSEFIKPFVDPWRAAFISSHELALSQGAALMFISSVIVNKCKVDEIGIDPNALANTSIPHLAWVLPMLESKNEVLHVPQPAILATAFNSGGYQALKVFAANYPLIFTDPKYLKNQKISHALKMELLLNFLPNVIRHIRNSKLGNFDFSESLPSNSPLSSCGLYRLSNWCHLHLGRSLFFFHVVAYKLAHRTYLQGWRFQQKLLKLGK